MVTDEVTNQHSECIWNTRNQEIQRRIRIFIFYAEDLMERIRQRQQRRSDTSEIVIETMNKGQDGIGEKFQLPTLGLNLENPSYEPAH